VGVPDKDTSDGRPIDPPGLGTIIPIPEVGGLPSSLRSPGSLADPQPAARRLPAAI